MNAIESEHKARFQSWVMKLRAFLRDERGRASRLAEHLGVPRQHVSRWFVTRSGDIPAWAAVTANVWYNTQLVRVGSDKLVCPPGERQAPCPGGERQAA